MRANLPGAGSAVASRLEAIARSLAIAASVLVAGCATQMYDGNERPAEQVATVAGSVFFFVIGSTHTCILSVNGKRATVSETSRFQVLPGEVVLHVAGMTDVGGLTSGCNSNLSPSLVRFRALAGRNYTVRHRTSSESWGKRFEYWVTDDQTGERVGQP